MTAWMTRREYYGGSLFVTDYEGEEVTATISFDVPEVGDEVTVIVSMAVGGTSMSAAFRVPKSEWETVTDRRLDVRHEKDLRWDDKLPWLSRAIYTRVNVLLAADRHPRSIVVTKVMLQALSEAGALSDDMIDTPAGKLPVIVGDTLEVLV